MTIGVAAVFPWGALGRALRELPGSAELSGIVFASDSRWSYPDGTHHDGGQKVWPLLPEQGIGAVLAGDVYSAEVALAKIGQRIRLLPYLSLDLVSEVASDTARQVYAAHQGKRGEIAPLQLLIGARSPNGDAAIVRIDSCQKFAPQRQDDVQTVGWPTAQATLQRKLAEIETAFLSGSGESWKIDIREWSLRLVSTLFNDVMEPGEEPTVGGGVQIVTLDRRGWNECRVGYLDLEDGTEWQQISNCPTELRQYVREKDLPPLAAGCPEAESIKAKAAPSKRR